MKLKIKLPENFLTENLLKQKNIPCLCRVSNIFEIVFQKPLSDTAGTVLEWDKHKLDERVAAGAGGKYIHYRLGVVTLEKMEEDIYRILYLSMFDCDFGWCPVLINGEYGPIGSFWGEDDGY